MREKFKLSIQCIRGIYVEHDPLPTLEISGELLLSDLHNIAQKTIHFEDNELHDCYIASTMRGKRKWIVQAGKWKDQCKIELARTIAETFLPGTNRKLFYFLDSTGDRIFQIRRRQ